MGIEADLEPLTAHFALIDQEIRKNYPGTSELALFREPCYYRPSPGLTI